MCPLTVDYSWGYTMPCKEHYSYTWTKGYGNDRLNAGGDEDGRQGNTSLRRYNEAFSLLLENAIYDGKKNIDIAYYDDIKSEIIGWK